MFTRKGFTLIEILIVLVILAAIIGLALPKMTSMVEKARTGEALQALSAVKHAEEVYFNLKSTYTTDMGILGVEVPTSTTPNVDTKYHWYYSIDSASATAFQVTATRTSKSDATNKDKTIVMTFDNTNNDITWSGTHPNKPE